MKQNDLSPAFSLQENIQTATVPEELDGNRADAAAAVLFDITRSAAERLISEGRIALVSEQGSREIILKKRTVRSGETLAMEIPEPEPAEAEPEDIPLDIVYEDRDIIVINKPQGMVVHPAPGHTHGTLVSALLYHCKGELSGIGGMMRPGIVHRIDKDTSGLIAVAKNDVAHTGLAAQLEDHSMFRKYRAIVVGGFRDEDGMVNAPIARHPTDRKKMAISPDGRRAVTHYRQLEELDGGFCLAEMRLETGRTHQIRVHMAHIGHPVLGDPVYGRPTQFEKKHPGLFAGQCLHAGELTFTHPRTGEKVTVKAPLPANFERIIELLRYN